MISSRSRRTLLVGSFGFGVLGMALGCASPGPPRPPSLQLPEPVTDLSATRSGNVVTLQFTLPTRSTDKTFLHPQALKGLLCREVRPGGSCMAVQGLTEVLNGGAGDGHHHGLPVSQVVTLHDTLPPALTAGQEKLLAYRVEFFGPQGSSAGRSDAAFTAAGAAPSVVGELTAQGSRTGVILHWSAANTLRSGRETVVIEREDLGSVVTTARQSGGHSATKRKNGVAGPMPPTNGDRSGVVLLDAHAGSGDETLDTTAVVDRPYRYTAYRQQHLAAGGQTVTVRSAMTPPVEFTLAAVYAPEEPTGLTAAGFANDSATGTATFVVSLIWQPVEDAGVAGYNVYRQTADGNGEGVKLNPTPVAIPAFEDATADRSRRYRYSVTTVDAKGNESAAAVAVEEPR